MAALGEDLGMEIPWIMPEPIFESSANTEATPPVPPRRVAQAPNKKARRKQVATSSRSRMIREHSVLQPSTNSLAQPRRKSTRLLTQREEPPIPKPKSSPSASLTRSGSLRKVQQRIPTEVTPQFDRHHWLTVLKSHQTVLAEALQPGVRAREEMRLALLSVARALPPSLNTAELAEAFVLDLKVRIYTAAARS